ncbi:hypothetical protein [Actinoplanes sp. NPDC051494]|uniref:hypothetical protein n=1 Tax=Actinoplanes sp. NPDC051494 TaxID=3363907 RepID=UPI0037A13F97
MSDDLRARLSDLVQENDPHRPLDSLESVVVRAYLTDQGYGAPAEGGPRNIEEWAAWADRRSSVS